MVQKEAMAPEEVVLLSNTKRDRGS
jgi:hypothetical protein